MRRARMGHAFRRRLRCNDYFDIDQRIHRGPCSISGGLFLMLQHGSIPMAIAVIIEFPGARRANYEKSVQLILKRRRNKLADWPGKGCACAYSGTDAWRLSSDRCLAIASGLHSFRQDAQAGFAKGRDLKGENEDFPSYQIHQILKLKLRQIRGLTHVRFWG